jgi:hypothetical protein
MGSKNLLSWRDVGRAGKESFREAADKGGQAFAEWWSKSAAVDTAAKYTVVPVWKVGVGSARWAAEQGRRLKGVLETDAAGRSFLKRQGERAAAAANGVMAEVGRKTGEVWTSKIAEPTARAINKDRPWVREQVAQALVAWEVASDAINERAQESPFAYAALQRLAAVRDAAAGMLPDQMQGMRWFSRRAAQPQGEVQGVVHENMTILRNAARGARARLSGFLASVGGVAERGFAIIPPVEGDAVSYDVPNLEAERQMSADSASAAWSTLRSFMTLRGVGRWSEQGLSDPSVARLAKVMRGLGAASLSATKSRGGAVAIGAVVGVMAYLGVSNFAPVMIAQAGDIISRGIDSVQQLDLSSVREALAFLRPGEVAAMAGSVGSPNLVNAASAVDLNQVVDVGSQAINAVTGDPNQAVDAVSQVANAVSSVDLSQGVDLGAQAVNAASAVDLNQVVDVGEQLSPAVERGVSLLDLKRPLESQAFELAGSRTGDYFSIIKEGVIRNMAYYQGEAQAFLNSPDPATRMMGRQALEALDLISKNPDLDPEKSQSAYQAFMRAASTFRM